MDKELLDPYLKGSSVPLYLCYKAKAREGVEVCMYRRISVSEEEPQCFDSSSRVGVLWRRGATSDLQAAFELVVRNVIREGVRV
mmetsp:Transcript_50727/g.130851  ORF Transcript_50727/g.130851 Transcript_50727/m.130851 type:complete len:84 (+) Transcript_50727:244-495(+)